MKKFISVLILLAFLSAAAFAEEDLAEGNSIDKEKSHGFKLSFELDMTQNLFSGIIPMDDLANTKQNPNHEYPGKFDFFTENRNDMRQSEMFLRLDWNKDDIFDARLELTGHKLVNGRDRGLRENYSFLDLFDELAIGDFWVRADTDYMNAAYGRLNNRGIMNDFRFDKEKTWWDRRYTGANLAGMNTLGPYRFFGYQMPGFRYTEVNNHGAIHGNEHYMLVGGKYNGFGLELSGSRFAYKAEDRGSAISLGVRGSGADIADLLNFELMYGITGQDVTMNRFGDNNEFAKIGPFKDGKGRWEHRYGLYGGLNLEDIGLGLSLGYSGGFLFYEKWEVGPGKDEGGSPNERDLQRLGPLFHAIDLKAQFSGNEESRLTITTAINATFSSVKGTKFEDDKWYMGLGIIPIPNGNNTALNEKQEEGFFGLAAGLNIGYMLSDDLDVTAQVKYSAQWEKYIDDNKEYSQFRNLIGAALITSYKFNDNFSVLGGLAVQMDRTKEEAKNLNTDGAKFGNLYFGIPITFHVTY